jgi:hypothetical protein
VKRCCGAQSACRAVGFAEAEGALHSRLQILRESTLGIVFMHWVLKDATPRNPRCFGALDVEKSGSGCLDFRTLSNPGG